MGVAFGKNIFWRFGPDQASPTLLRHCWYLGYIYKCKNIFTKDVYREGEGAACMQVITCVILTDVWIWSYDCCMLSSSAFACMHAVLWPCFYAFFPLQSLHPSIFSENAFTLVSLVVNIPINLVACRVLPPFILRIVHLIRAIDI